MPKKILIVDDEKIIQQLLSTILDDRGYQITCAGDGEEALRMVQSEIPDVVILDVRLPKVNGFDVCRLVKSRPSGTNVKVLMLSGIGQQSDRMLAKKAGADDFLTKPFGIESLLKKVTILLNDGAPEWAGTGEPE